MQISKNKIYILIIGILFIIFALITTSYIVSYFISWQHNNYKKSWEENKLSKKLSPCNLRKKTNKNYEYEDNNMSIETNRNDNIYTEKKFLHKKNNITYKSFFPKKEQNLEVNIPIDTNKKKITIKCINLKSNESRQIYPSNKFKEASYTLQKFTLNQVDKLSLLLSRPWDLAPTYPGISSFLNNVPGITWRIPKFIINKYYEENGPHLIRIKKDGSLYKEYITNGIKHFRKAAPCIFEICPKETLYETKESNESIIINIRDFVSSYFREIYLYEINSFNFKKQYAALSDPERKVVLDTLSHLTSQGAWSQTSGYLRSHLDVFINPQKTALCGLGILGKGFDIYRHGKNLILKDLLINAAQRLIHLQSDQGWWASSHLTQDDKKRWKAVNPYIDNRFCADSAMFLLRMGSHFENKEWIDASLKYAEYVYKLYKYASYRKTTNGGIFFKDYVFPVKGIDNIHTSLNHHLNLANYLFMIEHFVPNKKMASQYRRLAMKMFYAVYDTEQRWYKKNHDLSYALFKGKNMGTKKWRNLPDYNYVTLRDLWVSRDIIKKETSSNKKIMKSFTNLIKSKCKYLSEAGKVNFCDVLNGKNVTIDKNMQFKYMYFGSDSPDFRLQIGYTQVP